MSKTNRSRHSLFIIILLLLPSQSYAVSPIPDYDFDKHINDITNSNFDLSNITRLGAAPYEDIMGSIFWGVLFALIFGIMWISMEDITIPALLGFMIGGSMWYLMPADWVQMAMSLTVISFSGLVYSYFKKG